MARWKRGWTGGPTDRSAAEGTLVAMINAKRAEWVQRGVPEPVWRSASRMADERARGQSAYHLNAFRDLDGADPSLLPETTLRAVEGPLTVKMLREYLRDGAEHWVARSLAGYPGLGSMAPSNGGASVGSAAPRR